MPDNFEDAQIDGAFVRELVLATSNNVRMSFVRTPEEETEARVAALTSVMRSK